jgi:hypothetical protein
MDGAMVLALVLVGGVTMTHTWGCASRDCAEERAGEQRCVGNRIETCNEDGTLTYESCSAKDLFCSEELLACVTEEVAMSGSGTGGGSAGGGGAGGDGGSPGGGGAGGS